MSTRKDRQLGGGKLPARTQLKTGAPMKSRRARKADDQRFSTLVDRALAKQATVMVNGERKRLTRQQRAIRNAVYHAAKGDLQAVKLLLILKGHMKARGELPGWVTKFRSES